MKRAVLGMVVILSLGTGSLARAEAPAAIAIHVAELGELSLGDARPIVDALSASVERVTGRTVVVDDPTWSCESRATCAAEVAARTSATDVLLVDVFEGPTKRHVIAERTAIGGATSRADAYVARTHVDGRELDALAARLFPEPRVSTVDGGRGELTRDALGSDTGPSTRTVAGLVVLGIGVASGGASALFAASNADARSELRTRVLAASEHDALSSRAEAHGLAAGVLVGVAIASATTALVLLVTAD
ncbi:hypothetical protein L6R52_21970 [Myxococcota bacterium]|nr:hypothetical protein [Myxococcota bacterium]